MESRDAQIEAQTQQDMNQNGGKLTNQERGQINSENERTKPSVPVVILGGTIPNDKFQQLICSTICSMGKQKRAAMGILDIQQICRIRRMETALISATATIVTKNTIREIPHNFGSTKYINLQNIGSNPYTDAPLTQKFNSLDWLNKISNSLHSQE